MNAQWECFCDESYYHLWRVRRKNERGFDDGFHVHNKEEAEALVKLLNEADLWKAEAERWREIKGWQPIETAPRSTPVLVTDGAEINLVSIHDFGGYLSHSCEGVISYDFEPSLLFSKVTHWMPLPEPPQ